MSEQNYLNILEDVLNNGSKKSIFGHKDKYIFSLNGCTLKFDLQEGFPIFTTRQIYYKGAFKEMLWFIEGDADVVKLHKSGCKWWDDWGLKEYNKRSVISLNKEEYEEKIKTGEIKELYLPLHYTNMTSWKGFLDQTKWAIDQIRVNPDRKSYLVLAWNPEETYQMADICIEESVVLPACHFYHQLLPNKETNKLNLVVGIRSSDLFLGLPANVAQYALLLSMYAHVLNYDPGDLIVQLGDYHIYSDHVKQVEELITRIPGSFPKLIIKYNNQKYLQDFVYDDFNIVDYDVKYPQLKGELTVVGGY